MAPLGRIPIAPFSVVSSLSTVSLSSTLLAVSLLLTTGCESDVVQPPTIDSATRDTRFEPDQGADTTSPQDAGPSPDTFCAPVITDCTGYCGSVSDPCTGEKLQCGECESGKVCSIETHTCVEPLISCTDLGAECGAIKNSCGKRLGCGSCGDGLECDPDTNTCITCTQVTCQDMGFECGMAWLGCGNLTDPKNKTDCGACPTGKKCNEVFNICEDDCTPGDKDTLCAAAKARGVECGNTSDGCGGVVNCGGCDDGKQCGIYGVANRCEAIEAPDECRALGYECGTITSVCGGTVECGSCTQGDVCNDNHLCGSPCKPKTCAEFAAEGKECGSFPDNCKGTASCKCTSGDVCLDNSTCCTPAKCETGKCGTIKDPCTGKDIACGCESGQYCDTADGTCKGSADCSALGKGGNTDGAPCSDFAIYDKGGGAMVACPCTGGATCIDDGTSPAPKEGSCCVNDQVCDPARCNYEVTNKCTNAKTTCGCTSSQYCDASDRCQARLTCREYNPSRQVDRDVRINEPCSNGNAQAFPRYPGDTTGQRCRCDGNMICLDAGGRLVTGGNTGTCKNSKTCADFASTGNKPDQQVPENRTCSNGNSTAFPRFTGDTSGLRCRCLPGMFCVNGNAVVSGNQTGSCCVNTGDTCAPLTCNSQVVVNTCTGQIEQCTCPPNYYCNGTTCEPYKTCADYRTSNQPGQPCTRRGSTSPAFPRFPGDTVGLRCDCLGGDVCVDGNSVRVGSGATGTCLDLKTCDSYTNRNTGSACSNGANPAWTTGQNSAPGVPIQLTCRCRRGGDDCVFQGSNPKRIASGSQQGICTDRPGCGDFTTPLEGQSCNFDVGYRQANGSPLTTGTCPCSTAGGKTNNTCLNGTCSCSPDSCSATGAGADCRPNGTSDGCGGTQSCPCTAGSCSATTGKCCDSYTCNNMPPGYAAGDCGTIQNTCAGTSFNCSCSGGKQCNNSTNKCCDVYTCNNLPPGYNAGACGTIPNTCLGTSFACPCGSGKECNTSTRTCCEVYSCSNLPPGAGAASTTGKKGEPCGKWPDSCLGRDVPSLPCECDTSNNFDRLKCVNGICDCVGDPDVCVGKTGIQLDGCGGQVDCSG